VAVCTYHRDRPGVGVCMRCRSVICAECTTRVDGINHCHACLKELGGTAAVASGRRISGIAAALLIIAATWLFFAVLFWVGEGVLAP
jgi:hypothetical protein